MGLSYYFPIIVETFSFYVLHVNKGKLIKALIILENENLFCLHITNSKVEYTFVFIFLCIQAK